ncbi:ATP-dependent helicase [Caldalkalibacillus salinus]|uniref:ATP-dependent helicase n=1 Tax=Caldalkalibacillus salinus TaxID=2803787 RepID=UPI001924ABB7|nr:ATP-dependent helicase [Caldalkalibacillus salinus]
MTILYEARYQPFGVTSQSIPKAEEAEVKTSVELVPHDESDAPFFRLLEAQGLFLNERQIEACRHGEGPLLTLAGAGTGKTTVLVARTAYLIQHLQVDPRHILLMTFTKRAAEEMRQRIIQLVGQRGTQVVSGTFHSIFYRLLRHKGLQETLLVGEKRKQTIVKMILKEKGLDQSHQPETLLTTLSDHKRKGQTVHSLPREKPGEQKVYEVLTQYEEWKKAQQYIDFDDILLKSEALLKRQTTLLAQLQRRFQYVMVDEFQDTNAIQYHLVQQLAQPQNNVMVVGDEKQCIYSFQSADPSIILNFDQDYKHARLIELDINYRSSSRVVGLGNQIIKHNQTTKSGDLKATHDGPIPCYLRPQDTDEEAKAIIQMIQDEVKTDKRRFGDFAILHRTLTSSRSLFEQLVIQDIPFISYHDGEHFYEQHTVKTVIDHLRLSFQPWDKDALMQVIPTLYLNKENAMRWIEEREVTSPEATPFDHLMHQPHLRRFQQKKIEEKKRMIEGLKRQSPYAAILEVRATYDKFIEARDQTNTLVKMMLKETLEELETSARRFETVASFLEFIDTIIEQHHDMGQRTASDAQDAVTLMTIHKAKGLEYPVVFVTGASESILPHSSALTEDPPKDVASSIHNPLEEERRLTYVAVTRAKEALYVTSPKRYRGKETSVSRFFKEAF